MGASQSFAFLLFQIILAGASFISSSGKAELRLCISSAYGLVTDTTESTRDNPLQAREEFQTCYYNAHNTVWRWEGAHDHPLIPPYTTDTITSTQTLVYLVDSALGATTTTTILPADYMSKNFNQDGTRITTVTWERSGQSTTSVLTFPTGLVQWGQVRWFDYTFSGSQAIHSSSGVILPITSNPQPDIARFTSSFGPREASNDTRGSSYQLVAIQELLGVFVEDNEDFFLDQAKLEACNPSTQGGGPMAGAFTEVHWATSETTSFVDLSASRTTSSPEPGSTSGPDGPKETGDSTTSEATGAKSKGYTAVSFLLGVWAAFMLWF